VLASRPCAYVRRVLPRSGLLGDDMAAAEPSERELAMAHQLVEALSAHFEPTGTTTKYREQLRELIDRKAAGEEIVAEPAGPREPGAVSTSMAARSEPGPSRLGGTRQSEGRERRRRSARRGRGSRPEPAGGPLRRRRAGNAIRAGRAVVLDEPAADATDPGGGIVEAKPRGTGSQRNRASRLRAAISLRVAVIAVLPE